MKVNAIVYGIVLSLSIAGIVATAIAVPGALPAVIGVIGTIAMGVLQLAKSNEPQP